MCYQRIDKHPCHHATRYKPAFCRYRFNISHQVEPRLFYVTEPCSSCLKGKAKSSNTRSDVQREDGGARCEGEKEWKRKLRNRLERTGNEEVLRGSMMGEVPLEDESEWKRKLRGKFRREGVGEEVFEGRY